MTETDQLAELRRKLMGDPEPYADLWVTFLDGSQLCFNDIRFQATVAERNPIVITGTTIEVEDRLQTFTILGVRYFSLEHK